MPVGGRSVDGRGCGVAVEARQITALDSRSLGTRADWGCGVGGDMGGKTGDKTGLGSLDFGWIYIRNRGIPGTSLQGSGVRHGSENI